MCNFHNTPVAPAPKPSLAELVINASPEELELATAIFGAEFIAAALVAELFEDLV